MTLQQFLAKSYPEVSFASEEMEFAEDVWAAAWQSAAEAQR
jgi:hypothetical protein